MNREERLELKMKGMLDEILECNTVCESLGKYTVNKDSEGKAKVDEMFKYLPSFPFVRGQFINYMFSDGLTTGSEAGDAELGDWLEKENRQGSTNYSVLQEVVGNAASYGEWGLLWRDGDIYGIEKGRYAPLLRRVDGIDYVEGFVLNKDDTDIPEDFDIKKIEEMRTWEEVKLWFEDQRMILVNKDEFTNIRNEPTMLHGVNPFDRDQLRVKLLLTVYEQLNNDLEYNGPGRLILRPRTGFYMGTEDGEVSTESLFESVDKKEINKKAMMEAERVAKALGASKPDSIIVLSNAFDKEIDKLPKQTKSTEFFDWIENEGVILAQLLGMSPTLLETGELHGNVSVEKTIDNAMQNTIIPQRRRYHVQFSQPLGKKLGLAKVEFDKYNLKDVEEENNIRSKITNMIKDVAYAEKALREEGDYSNLTDLVDNLTEVLNTSLKDENGNIRNLR